MGREIEALAEFVATTRWDDVPEPVRRHTKLVFLDTLGVILAGSERPEVRQLRERLSATAGTGATVYACSWPQQDPRNAALLNGIAGRSIELCEGLRLVSGQAAMQVLPGVLAVGEQAGSSGREILAALLLGYEVVGRGCSGVTPAAARAGRSWRRCCSATKSSAGCPQASRRGRWRIRTARCRCSPAAAA